MANGAPQPNVQEVFEQIGATLRRLTRYLPAGDWEVKRLGRLAEQLVNADPAEGHNAIAQVSQMTGDRAKAIHHIDNAIGLAGNKPPFYSAKVAILCNLGYFSEALSIFKHSATPENGNMTKAWRRGYLCGAFRTMSSFLPKAKKMQFDLGGLDLDTAVKAANVMEKSGISDEDITKVLDVAGKVLREHKLFFVGDGLRAKVIEAPEHDAFVEISFDVDASPKETHALYREFVDQLVENVPAAPPALTVSFRPWKQQNERNAA
jgi:hypothetical protein